MNALSKRFMFALVLLLVTVSCARANANPLATVRVEETTIIPIPTNPPPMVATVATPAQEVVVLTSSPMATMTPQEVVVDALNPFVINLLSGSCPAEQFIDVQPHPENQEYPAPELNVTCGTNTFTIISNGIPTFEFVQQTPNPLQVQNIRYELPLNPTFAAATTEIPLVGPSAVTVSGLPIFGPTEAPQAGSRDPYLDQILDYCNGHTAQRGDYHFHARPDCLFETVEGQVGLVVAYAFDGYPILAPFICTDSSCTEIIEVSSSWQLTNSTAIAAWEQHSYVAGSGTLDQCNGMQFADGSYAYFATDTFPYFNGCYVGTPANQRRR